LRYFFDLDNTILDEKTAEDAAIRFFTEKYRDHYAPQEFREKWIKVTWDAWGEYTSGVLTFQGQRRKRVRAIDPSVTTDAEADRVFAEYLAVYDEAFTLYPDFRRILDHAGQFAGIITNGQTDQQLGKIRKFSLDKIFQKIFVSEACGSYKPDAGIFRTALRETGVRKEEAVHIGDSLDHDIAGALGFGIGAIFVNRNGTSPDRVPSGVLTVTSLDAIPF
jgi:putative hydrolase of the HAD superfamily